jgi:hypothetical protein
MKLNIGNVTTDEKYKIHDSISSKTQEVVDNT